MPKQVDTHVHVVSEDAGTYPLADGPDDAWYRTAGCTVERLLTLMDEAGVDAAVLVQAVSAYLDDNRYTAAAARAHADRCVAVACIGLDGAAPGVIVADLAGREGVRGLRWWGIGGEPLAEPRSVWDVVHGLGLPVVVTILADRLTELADVAGGLPPVPIALDHCGFADFSRGVPDELAALAEVPTVHLKVSTISLDAMGQHGDVRDGVAELAAVFGADRMMWGSDFSQTHDRPYPELAEHARHAATRLAPDDRDRFLGHTALALWPELA